ncbi:uncharacterized protein OCT59_026760 [Rhizophagus irregularis]|uniref:Uncharacterized protein n=1 Tax=Rhizophagus irregularis TaxID=588596 RepID=A0A915ZMM3_9GLOM|nr:hypothetical protein OCT59_026760 [Rhizophagus irregularis]GBC16361.2 hypothetical protein GLOIN_2v1845429 [Rhizophagus irregularis DAOM 181602=DAOM 197198]CAB4491269.1 unnamed protein product [Rhizophagus irregularis]CAB5360291.1 unnamed protein product [Rhizophagus irregularis]CAB5380330.1 unnamed protein product [Rhizophagus irregularis]
MFYYKHILNFQNSRKGDLGRPRLDDDKYLHGTFSFLAPHYRDFNNDVTFGEGDTFLDFATSSATSSATTNTAKQVKNHLGRKSQGIQKRQPIKKISYEEKFCCAKLAITSLEKTPDRFKSKLVTMRETSDEEATGSRVF